MAARNRTAPPGRPRKSSPAAQAEWEDIHRQLESICAVIAIGAGVLENQAADRDLDVAKTLIRRALQPFSVQIGRLRVLMGHSDDA